MKLWPVLYNLYLILRQNQICTKYLPDIHSIFSLKLNKYRKPSNKTVMVLKACLILIFINKYKIWLQNDVWSLIPWLCKATMVFMFWKCVWVTLFNVISVTNYILFKYFINIYKLFAAWTRLTATIVYLSYWNSMVVW